MLRLKIILQYKWIYIVLLLLSLIYAFFYLKFIGSKYDINTNVIIGVIEEFKVEENKLSFIVKGKERVKCSYYLKNEEERIYYESLKLGYKIKVTGSLSDANNNTIPETFNYKKYLKSNNIYYVMNVEKIEVINKKTNILYTVKNFLIDYINTYKSKDYLSMFILGDKSLLDDNQYKVYQGLGVSHIFAISGMHISFLSMFLLFLLKKLNDNKKYIIVISFLLFYAILLNFQPSITRSIVLFTFLFLNKKYDLEIDTINILYLDITFLLFLNPNYLLSVGFLYSSIISFSLIKYNKLIKGNYIKRSLIISTIALLFSLPITVNSNYEINILSTFNNLIIVPLVSFIIYPLSLIILFIKPLENVFIFSIGLLELISTHLFKLIIVIPKLNLLFIIIYYLILLLFFKTNNKKIFILLILLLFLWKFHHYLDNNYYIYYLDVGQGDSALIIYKNKCVMVDTGGKVIFNASWYKKKEYFVTDSTILFLKSRGITKINYLVLTHGDYDHMGEADNLINNIIVEKVIFNNDSYNKLEKELIKVLDKKNIKYYRGLKELNISNDKLYFLNTKEYDNENDNSNVIYFKLNNYKFLFMGDAGGDREKDILGKYNLTDIDFIKIGHHGSNTSSSEYFIDKIKPQNCLISVGKNNRYGHPKESVIDILDDYCNIYRTDLNGSIEIKINKNNYKIKTYDP